MATKEKAAEPLRKITIKTVMKLDKAEIMELCMKDKKAAVELCKIFGIAGRTTPGESDHGQFVRFGGQFKAVNLMTGEVFKAPAAIFPAFFEEELASALTGSAAPVEFAATFSAKYDKDAATSYVYLAENLIEPQGASEAMMTLEAKLAGNKALPSPKK